VKTIWWLLTTHCVCSWCKRRLRWAPLGFLNKFNTTHTICRCCNAKFVKQLEEAK
jgi:hypothetical protein